jgi:ribosomal protein L31
MGRGVHPRYNHLLIFVWAVCDSIIQTLSKTGNILIESALAETMTVVESKQIIKKFKSTGN